MQAQVGLDIAEVGGKQAYGGAGVTRFQCVDDGFMLGLRLCGGVRALVHQRYQGTARKQFGQHLREYLVALHARQQRMEVRQQSSAARHVGSSHGRTLGLEVVSQLCHLVRRDRLGQSGQHCRFQHLADLEDLASLLHAGLGDERPTCGLQRHQPVTAELIERLPNQRAGDLEDIGDLLLGQLGARHQSALDDGLRDGANDALGSRAALGVVDVGGHGVPKCIHFGIQSFLTTMGKLTTHVLDTMHGSPAAGMPVSLYRLTDAGAQLIRTLKLNADGRADGPLLEGQAMLAGRYRLVFGVAAYFKARGVQLPEPAFLDEVPLDFGIAQPGSHYHVPLLTSPWSYSTYRGS